MITAAFLIELNGILRSVEGAVAQSVFYVDVDVSQLAAIGNQSLGLVVALTCRVLTHINLYRLRNGASECYSATDGSCGRRINRCCSGRRFRVRRRTCSLFFVSVFLLVASCQE